MAKPNFENRTLYHCDNLDILQGMNSESVHLIATDPPFNKSRDFHATPDSLARGARFQDRWSWRRDIHDDWLIEIQRDYPDVWSAITAAKTIWGDDMGAFLCWLGVRLLEMHRVLRDDGSIYLHIDHTAHAYVKTLMDAVFGKQNFRNEIVWCYSRPSAPNQRQLSRVHSTLLWYAKGEKWTFNPDDIRQPYAESSRAREGYRADASKVAEGTVQLDKRGKFPESWIYIPQLKGNAKESTGYPTQKPIELYERVIKASSNEGDIVLDPFAGCATTPVAAERLGRQWVGIDIWEGSYDLVKERMEDNRQLIGDIPEITYANTPPFAQTMANLPCWNYRRRQAAGGDTRRRVSSVIDCFWTWARTARDAVVITALTRECWKLTMLCQSQMEGRTHTPT